MTLYRSAAYEPDGVRVAPLDALRAAHSAPADEIRNTWRVPPHQLLLEGSHGRQVLFRSAFDRDVQSGTARAGAARRDLPDLECEREAPFVADRPQDTPPDLAVVLAARSAARTLALPNSPTGVPYGSDARKPQALGGVPSIVLGPGSIAQAHTAEELVPVDLLSRAAELYAGATLNFAALLPPSGGADR